MNLDWNLYPSTSFCFHSDNIIIQYIDVGVMINDYHHHLREEGSGVFIKAVHDSHVGRACNGCNGSTICIYKRKLEPGMLMF